MQLYRKEFDLLKKTQSIVDSKFSHLGKNKRQEVTRLLYEIAKRENVSPETVIATPSEARGKQSQNNDCFVRLRRTRNDVDMQISYHNLKQILLKRRYPETYLNRELSRIYLPKLTLDPSLSMDTTKKPFYPKNIFVEKSASSSSLYARFKKNFPIAKLIEIKSLKDYMRSGRNSTIKDYNNRRDTAFITYENHDFFKACPCTKKAIRCGYHIFNLSFGCIFECTYCYLQEYTNTPGLIFPANIERFFKGFPFYKKPHMRIGTGEFSDSLMLDHITEYSLSIIDFFKKHKEVSFEFKTKSNNIDNLLKTKHVGNIVISWSLNPQKIIDENELFTTSLKERISLAKRSTEAGYKVAFHFDPVIYYKGWQKEYEKVIDLLFSAIKPKDIAWVSIGTLRFNPEVKKTVEMRFPGNKILDGELILGFDDKLRYPYSLRHKIYSSMLNMLFTHSRKVPIYLCMEDRSMWHDLNPAPNFFKL